jgi:hypothetical protein
LSRDFQRSGPDKRQPPGTDLKQHNAQGMDVGGHAGALAAKLFGRHVCGSSGKSAGGHGGSEITAWLEFARQAEIHHYCFAATLGKHHVGGFKVSVDDALVVGGVERIQKLVHDRRCGGGIQRSIAADSLRQGLAL